MSEPPFCSRDTPLLSSRTPSSLRSLPSFLVTPCQSFPNGWVLQCSVLNLLPPSTLLSSRITSPICTLNPSTHTSLAPQTKQVPNQTLEFLPPLASLYCLHFSEWHRHLFNYDLFFLVSPIVSSSKMFTSLYFHCYYLCCISRNYPEKQNQCVCVCVCVCAYRGFLFVCLFKGTGSCDYRGCQVQNLWGGLMLQFKSEGCLLQNSFLLGEVSLLLC